MVGRLVSFWNGTLFRGTFVSLPFHFGELHFDLEPESGNGRTEPSGKQKSIPSSWIIIFYNFLISEIWIMSLSHMKSSIKLEYLPLKSSNHFNLHHFFRGEKTHLVNQWIFVLHPATHSPPCKDFTFTMQGKRPGSSGNVTLIPRTEPRRFFRITEKSY